MVRPVFSILCSKTHLYIGPFSEPPHVALGYTVPEGYIVPVVGEDANGVFGDWVSSHYTHPDLASRQITGLEAEIPLSPKRPSTNKTLAPEELLSMIDLIPPRRSEDLVFLNISQRILLEQVRRAYFDDELASRFLPKLVATSFCCERSPWTCVWCTWELEKHANKMKEDGVKGRHVSFMFLDGGNHYVCVFFFIDERVIERADTPFSFIGKSQREL